MGFISRKQILEICVLVCLFFICGSVLIKPLIKNISASARAIYSVINKKNNKLIFEMKNKNETLLNIEKRVKKLSSSENSSAKWYEFIQNMIKKHNIEARRINSTGIYDESEFDVEDFSFSFKGTYHDIGKFINSVENSGFVCSVKKVHLISKSLLDKNLDVDITISFYKKHI